MVTGGSTRSWGQSARKNAGTCKSCLPKLKYFFLFLKITFIFLEFFFVECFLIHGKGFVECRKKTLDKKSFADCLFAVWPLLSVFGALLALDKAWNPVVWFCPLVHNKPLKWSGPALRQCRRCNRLGLQELGASKNCNANRLASYRCQQILVYATK